MQSTSKQTQPLVVDMVELKTLARINLSSSSILRDLILSEPDSLPQQEVVIKVKMYSKLLYREVGQDSTTS